MKNVDLLAVLDLPSIDATASLASDIGARLSPGDSLLLSGGIGAGKTFFTRALIKSRFAKAGLPDEDVPSPTYTIVQTYDDGLAEIWHADLYRLTSSEDVLETGLLDALGAAICIIEWPERLGPDTPVDGLKMNFMPGQDENARRVHLGAAAGRWEKLIDELVLRNR